MKINFIVPALYRTGGIRVIFEYANRLVKNGHDVVLYYPIKKYNMQSGVLAYTERLRFMLKGYNRYYFEKSFRGKIFVNNFKIKSVPVINNFTLRNADFTIATAWPTAYSLYHLNSKKGFKIYFIQDYEIWNSNISYVNKSYQLNMHRITISNYLKNLIKEKFNSDSEVIPNGINFQIFYNENKTFHLNKRITFIDYNLERKNVELSIQLVQRLKSKYNDLNFVSFGTDLFHKLPDYVKFTKNPDDKTIRNIYSNSDIFIYTSNLEGFGLPPFEAMACKCAVVTTKVGAIPDYIVHDHSALLIEPNDEIGFFKSICNLIDNPDKLYKISLNGYETVRKHLNWDRSVKKFEKYLLEL